MYDVMTRVLFAADWRWAISGELLCRWVDGAVSPVGLASPPKNHAQNPGSSPLTE